jgi:hypothetical protein
MKTSLLLLVVLTLGVSLALAASAQEPILRARGNPYLVDFMAVSNKRADLRMEVGRSGLDAAFSNWLRRERPLAYKAFVEESEQGEHR